MNSPLNEWIAIKSISTFNQKSRRPHDAQREANILARLSHPNIATLLDTVHRPEDFVYELHMPLFPLSLSEWVDSIQFCPRTCPPEIRDYSSLSFANISRTQCEQVFEVIAKSLSFQLLLATAYLHSFDPPIAHRDVKPANVMLTQTGCVKLIDFGTAWQETDHDDKAVLPSFESRGNMCFQVATGSFRAPELLFSARDYDPVATDLWSLGVTLAHFYRPLEVRLSDTSDDSDSEPARDASFIVRGSPNGDDVITSRLPLFDSARGEIGLAWSIFKIKGTPTDELWPDFKHLPDAQRVQFRPAPPTALKSHLPNLPRATSDAESPLDLIERLTCYSPAQRLLAQSALDHRWFSTGLPVVLPIDYPGSSFQRPKNDVAWTTSWEDKSLQEWLRPQMEIRVARLTQEIGPNDDEW